MPIAVDPITANGWDRPSYEEDFEERDDSVVNLKAEALASKSIENTLTQEPPRDYRDEAFGANDARPQSPYTLAPPIDFDGLSWPCTDHTSNHCGIL